MIGGRLRGNDGIVRRVTAKMPSPYMNYVSGELRRYLLEREVGNVSPLAGVLDSDAADVPVAVEIKQGVLIQVLGFIDLGGLEFDVKRARVLEILDFHGLNDPRCA